MIEKSRRIKEKFTDMMELPKELLMGVSRITMLGNENVFIENYKGIAEYEENIIRLANDIVIYGENFNIEEISDNEIMITGRIRNIEFE